MTVVCEAMRRAPIHTTGQLGNTYIQRTVWREQDSVRHASMTTTTFAMRSATINKPTHLN